MIVQCESKVDAKISQEMNSWNMGITPHKVCRFFVFLLELMDNVTRYSFYIVAMLLLWKLLLKSGGKTINGAVEHFFIMVRYVYCPCIRIQRELKSLMISDIRTLPNQSTKKNVKSWNLYLQ